MRSSPKSAPPSGSAGSAPAAAPRRRYAVVGVGARSQMYQDAIEGEYRPWAELVAFCDLNPGRVEIARQRSAKNRAPVPPGYAAADFARMIAETKPHIVVVTTVDEVHDDFIVRAMELGCDVITEKPMTHTAAKCRRILETRRRTGRSCRVSFNYRYSPPRSQVKDLLMSGEIGGVVSVDFHWLLNTRHGADYFRRWHSQKERCGGLMVHKSTHHFDLVNWWLGAMPVSVYATGQRGFYTPAMARRLGLQSYHERCHTCPERAGCAFFFDLSGDPSLKALYLEQEGFDGYIRDRCVFRPDIDIEDAMTVQVRYDNGVLLAYSLNAFCAWEGYTIAFNGTQGRLEHSICESDYVSGTDTVQGGIDRDGVTTRIVPLRGAPRLIEPWPEEGSHGGGDAVMLRDLFLPTPPDDKFLRAADERAGAASILVGVAANRCFETGQPVALADLVPGLERPDYPAMSARDRPLPMPERGAPG